MHKNIFTSDDNSTPLTEEEKQGLKAGWITTRLELNTLEAQGIANAELWLLTTKQKNIFSENFIKNLHKKMFGDIWKWAGKFRITERNIGVAPYDIQPKLKMLLDDIQTWIDFKTYSEEEIAIRFHHRLVQIHPFPNGNGRLSRIMADLTMKYFGLQPFNWGKDNLTEINQQRKEYISALQHADNGDYSKLINFLSFNLPQKLKQPDGNHSAEH